MFYDTLYRHNQALAPDGLETLPAALHALNAAVDDCRRDGKPIGRDAAILLLIRTLADVAERAAPDTAELRVRCAADRAAVLAAPTLLDIAGHSVAGDHAAKRTFHNQARRALARLAQDIGLDLEETEVTSGLGDDRDDGTSELRHAGIGIRVVPRSFLPDSARDGQTFGYKDMTEHMGPVESDCPTSILDLLTSIDGEWPNTWRAV